MAGLKRLKEKAEEDARADIQKQRIEQYDQCLHLRLEANPLTLDRIWENLSKEGWSEEITAHKSMYKEGLMKVKGVETFHPLGAEGVHISNTRFPAA